MLTAAPAISQEFSLERLTALWALDHPSVFWRHDVDHDLACAVRMARWEQEFGITAIYYLRTEASEYDCDSREFEQAVEQLLACGHRLGTHVEFGLPREAQVEDELLGAACEMQAAKLARWPVGKRVSLHRPGPALLWREIEGYQHALAPAWRGRYVSDSRRRFRSSPEAPLRSPCAIQINLHPCWWFLSRAEASRLEAEHRRLADLDVA